MDDKKLNEEIERLYEKIKNGTNTDIELSLHMWLTELKYMREEDKPYTHNNVRTFKLKDLNKKTLLMNVVDNEEVIIVHGIDVNTGETYPLTSYIK